MKYTPTTDKFHDTIHLVDQTTPVQGGTPVFDAQGNPIKGASNASRVQLADNIAYLKKGLETATTDVDALEAQASKFVSFASYADLDAYADYDKRLLDSRTREGVYKRQAEGSSSEQQRLAVHAAELDRSLVEGKEVARQLAATVRLRDAEIIALANVIRAYETMLKE